MQTTVDEDKFNADIAAMMKSHGAAINTLLNSNVAECVAAIVNSEPAQQDEREERYRMIRLIQDLQAQIQNCITYDEARRAALRQP